MCLLFLLVCLLYAAVAIFFVTARVLLPWTITATVLAGLATLVITRLSRQEIGTARLALPLPLMVVLTLCFGYMAWMVKPPRPQPPKPPKQGVEAYFDLLFTFPEPEVSKGGLWTMLPVHLTVAGLLGGVIVSGLVGVNLAARSGEPQAGTSDSERDAARAKPGATADGGRDVGASQDEGEIG